MVQALSPNELKVTWLPPNKPNGNVTHYMVYWQPQPLNREKLDQRNYCLDSKYIFNSDESLFQSLFFLSLMIYVLLIKILGRTRLDWTRGACKV